MADAFQNGFAGLLPMPMRSDTIEAIDEATLPSGKELKKDAGWQKTCIAALAIGLLFITISFIVCGTENGKLQFAQVEAKYFNNSMSVSRTVPDPLVFSYMLAGLLEFGGLVFFFLNAESDLFSLAHSSIYGGLFFILHACVVTCLWMDAYQVAMTLAGINWIVSAWAHIVISRMHYKELNDNPKGGGLGWESFFICGVTHAVYLVTASSIALTLFFALGHINMDTNFGGIGEDTWAAIVIWLWFVLFSALCFIFWNEFMFAIFSAMALLYQAYTQKDLFPHTWVSAVVGGGICALIGIVGMFYLIKYQRAASKTMVKSTV